MNWKNWVIDASMSSPPGSFCFCPIEGDLDGEYQIVTGMNYLSDRPPGDGKVVAVVHENGPEAVEAFCAERKAELDTLRRAMNAAK